MKPTSVRFLVLGATMLVAVFMYVDRVCLSQVKGLVQRDLALDDYQIDWVLSAFFWSYALAQVPAGALGVQYGYARMLAVYLFLWSLFTALTGLATGFLMLLAARLVVGLTEAGAYPTAASLVKGWFPTGQRGRANSVVALGGRAGGALGQRITPVLVVALAGVAMLEGWRVTLVLFGVLGMLASAAFYLVAKDCAADHPWANEAEADLAEPPPPPTCEPFPWLLFLATPNLWLSGLTQFGVNIGWVFLITHFPDYLEKVHGLEGNDKGFYASLPLTVGIAGMFAGGFLTDALVPRIGLRWGRALPIGVALFGCAAAFAVCASATDPLAVTLALCAVTLCVDLGIPSIWAFAQDIGGRYVGPVLGYGNMWGNIGAAVSPLLLGYVQRHYGWPAAFQTCALAFVVAACAALCLNAAKPLRPADALRGSPAE